MSKSSSNSPWLNPLKQISLVKIDPESLQQRQVFLFEGLLGLMLFLILYVLHHRIQLGPPIRESAETFLPIKSSTNPLLSVDEN